MERSGALPGSSNAKSLCGDPDCFKGLKITSNAAGDENAVRCDGCAARRLCDDEVQVGLDPWAATGCKLEAGHAESCSPLYPDERH